MSQFSETTQRLETALERLDKALNSKAAKTAKETSVWQDAVKRAETDQASAEQRDEALAGRLDSVIGRLKSMVEG